MIPVVARSSVPELVGRTPEYPDLKFTFPESARDYYALHKTSKHRERHEVYVIKDALLTVDYTRKYRYHFCIQDSNGNPFKPDEQQFLIDPQNEIVPVSGRVAFADDRFTKFNVCHFLFDKLWRAACFERYSPDSYGFLAVNDYVKNALDSLGMPIAELPAAPGKIITYQIEELLVSTSSMDFRHPGNNFAPEVQEVLQKLDCVHGIPSSESGKKRYFVDRADARTRRILNRDEVNPMLECHNIETIMLEGMSLQEQIKIFNKAEVVLGVHGAGLSNAYFCRSSETKVLEILPPLCATADYWKLAMAKGFHYDAFIAADPEHAKPDYREWEHRPAEFNRRDVLVDVQKFGQFLDMNLK